MNSSTIYTNYILFPCLIFFTISLPLPIAYSSIAIISLAVVFLMDIKNIKLNFKKYYSKTSNILLFLICSSIFISFTYSYDKKEALNGVLSSLPLFAIPLSLTTLKYLTCNQIKILKKTFVFTCFATSVFYFLQTAIQIGLFSGSYKSLPPSTAYKSHYLVYHLTYHQLTPSIHAVFYSFYLALSIILIIFTFKRNSFLSRLWQWSLIIYFLVYMFLLTSASMNFALYSFLILYFFYKFTFSRISEFFIFFGLLIIGTAVTDYLLIVKSIGPDIGDIFYKFDSIEINQKIILSFIVVLFTAVFALLVKIIKIKIVRYGILVSYIVAAFLTVSKSKDKSIFFSDRESINNLSLRATYGKESLKIIKKNWLWGVGIGDLKVRLVEEEVASDNKKYFEFGYGSTPDDNFNSHNQFLNYWMAAGLVPFLCLIFYFISQFSKALSAIHIPWVALVFFFFIFCFTDKALTVERGHALFLFFIALFENEWNMR